MPRALRLLSEDNGEPVSPCPLGRHRPRGALRRGRPAADLGDRAAPFSLRGFSGKLRGNPRPLRQCQQFTASNFAHVQVGRAHDNLGFAHANGSNQRMGLNNIFFSTTLAETAPDFYVVGSCP
jgi:hypothetical protein